MTTGQVQYIGNSPVYQVKTDDKMVAVKKDAIVSLPLHICKELIEKTENFVPTNETAETLKKYAWGTIDHLKKIFGGKRIFIIGSGASLKGFDFSRLDNEHTIVMNHTLRFYKNASLLIFLDGKFIKECKKQIDEFRGYVFASYRSDYNPSTSKSKGVYCFPTNRRMIPTDVNLGLFNGELTGLCALNLALILGCEPIYLLGFDLNENPPYYFFDDEFTVKKKYKQSKIHRCLKYFERFRPYAHRVVNCSMESNIRAFNKMDIDSVLSKTAKDINRRIGMPA